MGTLTGSDETLSVRLSFHQPGPTLDGPKLAVRCCGPGSSVTPDRLNAVTPNARFVLLLDLDVEAGGVVGLDHLFGVEEIAL